MIVLMFGDVVGDGACSHLRKKMPEFKKKYKPDVVIANGENASEGNGILPSTAKHLRDSGVDIITLGNHGLRRKEIYDSLDRNNGLIRPYNYHENAPGFGYYIYDSLKFQLCVVNLQGDVYMQSYESPFSAVDRLLSTLPTKNIIVDFHSEATSEKLCMGYYLDGKVSAVVGTHTHVPTADARILPNGTGYITDVGMCGGYHSILGVRTEDALYRMTTELPTRFLNEKQDIRLSGVVLEIDNSSGSCTNIESFAFV